MQTFPTINSPVEAREYSEDNEDPALRSDMEGGYVVSRPRHTRAPRRVFTVSYPRLSWADKQTLDNFWSLVRGGSDMFEWVNPADDTIYIVRFKGKLKHDYVMYGKDLNGNDDFVYKCKFDLEEV